MGEISFSEICGLARALEPHVAGARPRERVPLQVRDRDDRVVERRLDVRLTVDDVLLLPPPCLLRLGLRHLSLSGLSAAPTSWPGPSCGPRSSSWGPSGSERSCASAVRGPGATDGGGRPGS